MNDFNNTQSASQEQMKQVGRQAAGALNRHKKPLIIIVVILSLLALLWNECFFVVNEKEQAVVSRFGVIKQVILNEESSFYERYADQLQDEITMNGEVKIKKGSGLHFRVPFIDKVEKFSSMLYTYTSNSETINTSDKKQYNVTTYAQWRIAEPALFSLKLGNPRNAENQLDNLIHPHHRTGHQQADRRRLHLQQGRAQQRPAARAGTDQPRHGDPRHPGAGHSGAPQHPARRERGNHLRPHEG